MRILHLSNIAGQAAILSKALRSLGYQASSVAFAEEKLQYPADINLHFEKRRRIGRAYQRVKLFWDVALHYDVVHFHYGRTILPNGSDLALLRALGKRLVVTFHGSDVRNLQVIYNAAIRARGEKPAKAPLSTSEQKKTIQIFAKYANVCLVTTPDLLEYVPGAVYLPAVVSLEDLPFVGSSYCPGQPIRILHAPSKRDLKGTDFLLTAVDRLVSEGQNLELILVEGTPHEKTLQLMANSDIVVDQLLIGWYGVVSIEAMALGKPVVCYIRDDLLDRYAGRSLPILNANPENVFQVLKEVLDTSEKRKSLGMKGRTYVQTYHEDKVIAQKLVQIYSCVLDDRS